MVGKKATNKASKEGRSEGMQELEWHYTAINFWKVLNTIILERFKVELDK